MAEHALNQALHEAQEADVAPVAAGRLLSGRCKQQCSVIEIVRQL